jgi:hypothetical protein
MQSSEIEPVIFVTRTTLHVTIYLAKSTSYEAPHYFPIYIYISTLSLSFRIFD